MTPSDQGTVANLASVTAAIEEGQAHHIGGRLDKAATAYKHALLLWPEHPDALHLLGMIARQVGNNTLAVDRFKRAIIVSPRIASFHVNLANALTALGELDDAAAACRQALAVDTEFVEAHNSLGNVLQRQGKFDDAVTAYHRALASTPDYVEANINLAVALQAQGKFDDAVAACHRALDLKPDCAEARNNLGITLQKQGKLAEAIVAYDGALASKPNYPEALTNLGEALREQGRLEDALAVCQKALALQPTFAGTHNHLANILHELGRLDEAIDAYHGALALNSDFPVAHNGLGNALKDQGRLDEAMVAYQRALSLNPGLAEAHMNLATVLLLRGDFAKGFDRFQWRQQFRNQQRRDIAKPEWNGGALAGRTIMLHAEGGHGDTFQFVRYAPILRDRGARVIVECWSPQERLLRSAKSIDALVTKGSLLPDFDVHAPMMSLPHLLGTTIDTIPANIPYLAAEPALVTTWRKRLETKSGLRVGASWQGNPSNRMDRIRSMPLSCLEPIGRIPELRLIGLQKQHGRDQPAELDSSAWLEDLGSALDNGPDGFIDTAAVMENLDLVITIDTSIAHLAGALGRPVWLMLPHVPDWRWMIDRHDSPWYPTARLFRQPEPGNWAAVIDQVADALRTFKGTSQ